MPDPITIYSTPNCAQCRMTYRILDAAHVTYQVVDVSCNEAALAYVQELGYSQAPVVVLSDHEHWSGFRPDLLATLTNATQHEN